MENNKEIKGFCRGCMIKFDDPTELLQYTEKNRRLYVYSTGLQVKRNDTFTFQLCKDCYVNMKLACNFKKQCRASDKRFRHYLGLKEEGDTTDFCTFLKNSDDSFMFRLPLMGGNSTPAIQKSKDDDNESTCTSIRNFMTDIIRADDIPDTEARFIREVMEEEADVLDDSLDSHWLQDDASVDNDFRLDLSFSPFSTPRSVNNERCFTPQKLKESFQNQLKLNNYVLKEILKENSRIQNVAVKEDRVQEYVTLDDNRATVNENDCNIKNDDGIIIDKNDYTTSENHGAINESNYTANENHGTINESNYTTDENLETKYIGNFYVDNFEQINDDVENGDDVQKSDEPECAIDRNLKEALSNDRKEYSLKDLLGTPQVFPGASAMSTPTITNILFGEKLDLDLENVNADKQVGQSIEKYENVDGEVDILEEFFQKGTEEFDLNEKNPLEFDNLEDAVDPWNPLEIKYNLKDFFCNVCSKKFQSGKAIKLHIAKRHGERIIGPKKKYERTKVICDYCGKSYHDRGSIKRHIKLHMKPNKPSTCERCKQIFSSQGKLRIHMATHTGKAPTKNAKNKLKKYVCNLCGFATTKGYSLTIHQKRHAKSYSHTCNHCGKGFCTKSEMDVHARTHNGVKPFACTFCDKRFTRRDSLNIHTKIHLGERNYKCTVCKKTFIKERNLKLHKKNSAKCLDAQHKSIVEQLISANKVSTTYFYVVSGNGEEDKSEYIVPEVREENTSNLSSKKDESSKTLQTDEPVPTSII